jgi:hypothetical protein
MIGDEIANPLTVQQDESGDPTQPEIPVAIWRGSSNGIGSELMPVDSALYEQAKEIDLGMSRIMNAGLKADRGSWVVERAQGAPPLRSQPMDEGINALEPDQSLSVVSVPSSNVAEGREVVEAAAQYVASANGVPSYEVSVGTKQQIPSGVALLEMAKPANNLRQTRWTINRDNMDRIFEIEKALASMENGTETGAGVDQVWEVGPFQISETEMERLQILKELKGMGIKDNADILIEIDESVDSREDAERVLSELTPAAPAQPQTGGALARLRGGGQQQVQ